MKLVGFNSELNSACEELKAFLNEKLYNHYRVVRMSIKAQRVLRELFTIYLENPSALPSDYHKRIQFEGLKAVISDYIAGMTDRYAMEEHSKLTDPMIRV